MKGKWKFRGILFLTLILMLMLGITSAFAQDDYAPVSGSADAISVKKVLDLNGAEAVPEHKVTINTSFLESLSEPRGLTVTGSVPSVVLDFDDTLSINQAFMTGVIDFSKVSFSKPGKYRFYVNEIITGNSNVVQKSGGANYYYIDVWVQNDVIDPVTGKTTLKITNYNVYKDNATTKYNSDGSTAELLFNNTYNYYRFYVEKKVDGNVGDKSKEFKVWVNIKGLAANNTIVVRGVSGTPVALEGTGTGTNYQDVTAAPLNITPSSGAASCTLSLKDTDKVVIEGLGSGASFRVQESSSEATGYTISYNPTTANSGSSTDSSYTLKIPDNNGQTVTITNKKTSSIPTGIFINNWPYILVALVALAGCIIFVRKRRARYEYEADL